MSALIVAVVPFVLSCDGTGTNERWETSQPEMSLQKIQEAYAGASSREDFEQKVNNLYGGEEIISIEVLDKDATTQVVTGFVDKNTNGLVDSGEDVFQLTRTVTAQGQDGEAQISAQNTNTQYVYGGPSLLGVFGAAMLGSMVANSLSPNYRPSYSQPYRTSTQRRQSLSQQRSAYRSTQRSTSNRSSGSGWNRSNSRGFGSSSSSGSRRGFSSGGSFGREKRQRRVVRLTA